MSSIRSQRHIQKPERFVEIQQLLSIGRFHGRKDTYDRHIIQTENIQLIKQKNEFHGYDGKDGFVVHDEEEYVSSEEENDEELVPSDTESENDEEEELDIDSDSDEEIESEQEESN
jgi:hypothetical protein